MRHNDPANNHYPIVNKTPFVCSSAAKDSAVNCHRFLNESKRQPTATETCLQRRSGDLCAYAAHCTIDGQYVCHIKFMWHDRTQLELSSPYLPTAYFRAYIHKPINNKYSHRGCPVSRTWCRRQAWCTDRGRFRALDRPAAVCAPNWSRACTDAYAVVPGKGQFNIKRCCSHWWWITPIYIESNGQWVQTRRRGRPKYALLMVEDHPKIVSITLLMYTIISNWFIHSLHEICMRPCCWSACIIVTTNTDKL